MLRIRLLFSVLIIVHTGHVACSTIGDRSSDDTRTKRSAKDRPNFIVLFMDDLGYGDLGFTGHPTTSTPNLDYLAWNGKILTTWYSGCSVCTGSRSALMTGRQWTRTGLPSVLGPVGSIGLPLNETTIAEQLKQRSGQGQKKQKKQQQTRQQQQQMAQEDSNIDIDTNQNNGTQGSSSNISGDSLNDPDRNGYATGIVGKWHLGQRRIYLPGNRGFDFYLGIPYSDDMGNGITSPCPNTAKDYGSRNDNIKKRKNKHPMEGANKDHNQYYDSVGEKLANTTTSTRINSYTTATMTSTTFESSSTSFVSAFEKETSNYYTNEDGKNDPAAMHLPLVYQEFNKTKVVEQPVDFTTLAEKYNTFAVNFIKKHQDQPFFLYVPFSHVHCTSPNISKPEKQYAGCNFKDSTKRGRFGDALAEADWIVGNIIQTLQQLDLEENTLILFTSDNGPWLSGGLSAGSAGLFTGRYANYYDTGKDSTWEGGIRMPAFAYWKGMIQPHSRSAELVSSLDVFPTLSRLAGNIPLPTNRIYDGRDMTDILLYQTPEHRQQQSQENWKGDHINVSEATNDKSSNSNDRGGVNEGKSKHNFLFFYGNCNLSTVPYYIVTAVRHGPYKAHWCTAPGRYIDDSTIHVYDKYPLLFDVEKDPSEAEPLNSPGNILPNDPIHREAMERILKAYAMELSTFTFGRHPMIPYPDGPNEGPGLYGVCCNRSKNCYCRDHSHNPTTSRKSDKTDGGDGDTIRDVLGILNIGTKRHHDKYHNILGEEEPSPPISQAQWMLRDAK